MRTNIDIDDELMARAMEAGGFKTKREAVEEGLCAGSCIGTTPTRAGRNTAKNSKPLERLERSKARKTTACRSRQGLGTRPLPTVSRM